jgi:hypothetical protein
LSKQLEYKAEKDRIQINHSTVKASFFESVKVPSWITFVVLFAALFLMYSSSFTTDYLMNDELALIGQKADPMQMAIQDFYRFGRPVWGFFRTLIFNFSEYNPIRVQHMRFVNFFLISLFGLGLTYFFWDRSKNVIFTFFVVVFFMSQLPIQALNGYSLIMLGYHFSILLSFSSFILYFYILENKNISLWVEGLGIFILLVLAMFTFQGFANFCMIPLSFYILFSKKLESKKIFRFYGLIFLSFLFSILIFTTATQNSSYGTYHLVRTSLFSLNNNPLEIAVNGLNPLTYWSAFKIWTFPYPFHHLAPMGKLKIIISIVLMALWVFLLAAAFFIELTKTVNGRKKYAVQKWSLIILCIFFSGIFILADSPNSIVNHRAHLLLPLNGVVIFTAAYSLKTLSSKYKILKKKALLGLSITLIILSAFGAQRGLSQGIVDIKQNQMNFIRAELSQKNPDEFNKVIVFIPKDFKIENIREPSDYWFGHILPHPKRLALRNIYIYALHTLGIEIYTKKIKFVHQRPESLAANELLIDWSKYLNFAKGQRKYYSNIN